MSDRPTQPRKAVRLRIEGRVQGVGFRAWLTQQATGLGLDGWVRNRRDGGVEAVLAGPADAVDDMTARCRKGPSGAVVAMVKVLDEMAPSETGFSVRPTT